VHQEVGASTDKVGSVHLESGMVSEMAVVSKYNSQPQRAVWLPDSRMRN
jgi:hypothetical protein